MLRQGKPVCAKRCTPAKISQRVLFPLKPAIDYIASIEVGRLDAHRLKVLDGPPERSIVRKVIAKPMSAISGVSRRALQYGVEACSLLDATGTPEYSTFDEIRRSKGLGEAMKWRDAQFAPFE
jgi:hypothetical protein